MGGIVGGGGGASSGGGGGAGGGAFLYVSPQDFTATRLAATQLTLAGIPYVPTVEQFLSVEVFKLAGTSTKYTPAQNHFSWDPIAGTLEITGAAFLVTDEGYVVMVAGPDKAYDVSADATRTTNLNPDYSWYQGDVVANVTHPGAATYSYYVDMSSYSSFALHCVCDGGAGALSITIAASLQDDGTAAASCSYVDVSSSWLGAAAYFIGAWPDSAIFFIDPNIAAKYVRISVVVTGADTHYAIYLRRIYT